MKTKIIVFSAFTLTLFASATVITTLFNTTPTSRSVLLTFYISSFVAVAGLTFLLTYVVAYAKFRLTPPWQSTLFGLRLSTIVGVLTVLLLLMASYGILSPATTVVVLIIAVLTELVWRRRRALI